MPHHPAARFCLCWIPWLLGAQSTAPDPLLDWMNRIAQQQLAQRESRIAQIRTSAGAERRKQQVREKLLEIIGGLPDYRGPLQARTTGRLTNPSYTLEKVIFESLPHYFVTANLYLPNQPSRYPAVLLSAGHTTLGKAENHRIAANLAAKGFVALAHDPVGLGERMQAFDRRIGKIPSRLLHQRIPPGRRPKPFDRPERGPVFHLGRHARARLSVEPAGGGSCPRGRRRMLRRRLPDHLYRRPGPAYSGRRSGLLPELFPGCRFPAQTRTRK